jgi:peptidoglycan/xylan/chitin deacetylase (PgdA/CDA1 family)
LLKKYGLVSTQYLNSQPVVDGYPDYMTYQMVKDFKTQGSELAWHTRTHADITTLNATQLNTELTIPDAFLQGTGTTAADYKNFASPYGAYNSTSLSAVMAKYRSHRSTDVGYNSKDNFDITNIKVQNIEATTTPADVQNWVNQAIATKTWLVIVYHEVDSSTSAEDKDYYVTPANLDSELNIVKQSGITVKTVDQALDEVTAQL